MAYSILSWLGFQPKVSDSSLEEIARFCAALVDQFGDRLPSRFERSLPTLAAWWSIALYVQFPTVIRVRRFDAAHWHRASCQIADRMMRHLFPDFPENGPEKDDLCDALQQNVLAFAKLWIAAFGFVPRLEHLQDARLMQDRLIALFENEELELRERLDLSDDDDDGAGATVLLCQSFAVFFEICARSRI